MRLLVIGDSLTFHGPVDAVGALDRRTWPWVAATAAGAAGAAGAVGAVGAVGADRDGDGDVEDGAAVDLVARPGWTARDAWWAVTRDPVVWSVLVPRADALVLAVGGMDALPASLPTWWREGIATLRPAPVRRAVRRGHARVHPVVVRATRGRWRSLPQAATDRYLTRVVEGVRYFRPGLPVVVLTPPPWRSERYPVRAGQPDAVRACHAWAAAHGVVVADVDAVVHRMHAEGRGNPDGLHWDWATHAAVGRLTGARVHEALGRSSGPLR